MTHPTLLPFPHVSSWGRDEHGLWRDETGVGRDRAWWMKRYAAGRGRPWSIPPARWDEARDMRIQYHYGCVSARAVAEALGVSKATCARLLSFNLMWWL